MVDAKIYIAGHRGLVGSAVYRIFRRNGYRNIVTKPSNELDLRNQKSVREFFGLEQPDVIILAAAHVGGIWANKQYPYQFLYDNLAIQNNVIDAAHSNDVDQLIFLGSSCIYPKYAAQPLKEKYLLTGSLEPTNEWYAIAKLAGIKLCQALRRQYGRNYVSLMPTNLYGPGDNFELETSHVIPAMIRKFHQAKEDGHRPVELWGTGKPRREFLYVSDVAKAVLFAYENQLDDDIYNIGTAKDLPIKDLAELIQRTIDHRGEIVWDTTKPDGTPRKLLDVSKMHYEGWHHQTTLQEGLRKTYQWYRNNKKELRKAER